MTIRVTIKNEDTARNVIVSTREHAKDGSRPVFGERFVLKPGMARDWYVHLLRDLLIEEETPQ